MRRTNEQKYGPNYDAWLVELCKALGDTLTNKSMEQIMTHGLFSAAHHSATH